jgi:hypothetical protein
MTDDFKSFGPEILTDPKHIWEYFGQRIRWKHWRFLTQNTSGKPMIQFLQKLAVFWTKKRDIFCVKLFGEI